VCRSQLVTRRHASAGDRAVLRSIKNRATYSP